jgi:hypothetical protein
MSERVNMRNFGVKAGIVLAVAMLLCSCSEKNPVGPGGEPELFFNWLPALLADQASAQPCHELMQFLDSTGTVDPWANKDREAIQSTLDRLGNCPAVYRQGAAGYETGDEPILDAILVYVQEARSFLAGNTQYAPHFQQSPTLQQDRG